MRNRQTKIGREERINKILELIGQGMYTFQIVDICTKEWGVTRRTIEKYLTHVYSFMSKELTKEDKDKVIMELKEEEKLFKQRGEISAYLKLKDMRLKVSGQYQTKIDHTTNGKDIGFILNINKPNE